MTFESEAASIPVSWNHWSEDIDYGTGPVDYYYVHYERNGIDQMEKVFSSPVNLTDVVLGFTYNVAISVVRIIDSTKYEGTRGPNVTVRLPCGGKNSSTVVKVFKIISLNEQIFGPCIKIYGQNQWPTRNNIHSQADKCILTGHISRDPVSV